uniref:CooT family nickel-binding protein n=1 Tax=Angiostrongylus cantonensis TaxID=6313 RepID=A0A0K0D630_ANGCA
MCEYRILLKEEAPYIISEVTENLIPRIRMEVKYAAAQEENRLRVHVTKWAAKKVNEATGKIIHDSL